MCDVLHEVDEIGFDAAVARGVTLVDFWAPWCGPCRQLTPILERLSAELEGRVSFLRVDLDASPSLGERFEILSIPTLLSFKDGERKGVLVGAHSHEKVKNFIGRVL